MKTFRQINDGTGLPSRNPLMIGRSALGELLLEQFKRMGWTGWRVMDSDARLSQNIARHIRPKVSHGLRLTGFMKFFGAPAPTKENAGVEKKKKREKGGARADLIVDVSGASSVRWTLASKNVARCASMFINPPGDYSVLLLEDWGRSLRLDRIEPQYYRWLIHHDPGWENGDAVCAARRDAVRAARRNAGAETRMDAGGEAKGDEGGADCHRISGRIPPDALALHEDALRGRFLSVVNKPAAAVILCRRRKDARGSTAHCVEPYPSLTQNICGWRIVWDKGVENKVLEMRWKEIPRKTGGVILGCVDKLGKSIFVVDVCSAPEDSEATQTSFLRGSRGVSRAVETAKRRTGNVVNYVGEWRSRPDAMFPIPGMKDLDQLTEAQDEMALTGHPPVILIIGEDDLMFHVMMYE